MSVALKEICTIKLSPQQQVSENPVSIFLSCGLDHDIRLLFAFVTCLHDFTFLDSSYADQLQFAIIYHAYLNVLQIDLGVRLFAVWLEACGVLHKKQLQINLSEDDPASPS